MLINSKHLNSYVKITLVAFILTFSIDKATMTIFAEDRQALHPFVDQQSSTPSLIKLFVKKMKVLKVVSFW